MRTRSSVCYTVYDQTVIYDANEARAHACNFPPHHQKFLLEQLRNATSKVTKIFDNGGCAEINVL